MDKIFFVFFFTIFAFTISFLVEIIDYIFNLTFSWFDILKITSLGFFVGLMLLVFDKIEDNLSHKGVKAR